MQNTGLGFRNQAQRVAAALSQGYYLCRCESAEKGESSIQRLGDEIAGDQAMHVPASTDAAFGLLKSFNPQTA
jgi:hypothetical protein